MYLIREVLNCKPSHLHEVAHGGLAAIGLPVRICGKAHGRIERQGFGNGGEALRVQRQNALKPHQAVENDEAHGIECQHGEGIGLPVLFLG